MSANRPAGAAGEDSDEAQSCHLINWHASQSAQRVSNRGADKEQWCHLATFEATADGYRCEQ